MQNRSCSEHTLATDCIDLLLSRLGEKPGLDDDRNLRADTLTEKLGVALQSAVLFHEKRSGSVRT